MFPSFTSIASLTPIQVYLPEYSLVTCVQVYLPEYSLVTCVQVYLPGVFPCHLCTGVFTQVFPRHLCTGRFTRVFPRYIYLSPVYRYIYLSIPLSPVYTCLTCGLAGNIVTIVVVLAATSAGEEPLFAPVEGEQETSVTRRHYSQMPTARLPIVEWGVSLQWGPSGTNSNMSGEGWALYSRGWTGVGALYRDPPVDRQTGLQTLPTRNFAPY